MQWVLAYVTIPRWVQLRLDVGIIVDRRSGEDFGRIEFSIGQAF